jgi:DNA-binding ferritin-like protein
MVRNMWKRQNKELHEKESCEAKLQEHNKLNDNIDRIFDQKRSISNRCMTYGVAAYFKKKKEHIKRMRIKRKSDWVRDAEEILESLSYQTEQAQQFLKYFQFCDMG